MPHNPCSWSMHGPTPQEWEACQSCSVFTAKSQTAFFPPALTIREMDQPVAVIGGSFSLPKPPGFFSHLPWPWALIVRPLLTWGQWDFTSMQPTAPLGSQQAHKLLPVGQNMGLCLMEECLWVEPLYTLHSQVSRCSTAHSRFTIIFVGSILGSFLKITGHYSLTTKIMTNSLNWDLVSVVSANIKNW